MEFVSYAKSVAQQVEKVVVGKEEAISKILMAIIAGGHILVDDIPGVGKTTMALSFSKAMGLKEKRVQFTPDVLPADLVGFSIYRKDLGEFVYQPGAVLCNLFLADEINRTSPKTQSALLEVMEERQVTVDGVTREVGSPFVVIATQNPEGSAGTQTLPDSQLDRFMICIRMGYPEVEQEVEILKRRHLGNPLEHVEEVLSASGLVAVQKEVQTIYIHDAVYFYMAQLAKATREHELLELGLSPRGTVALAAMAKSCAYLKNREYVIPEDIKEVFTSVALHRIRLSPKARVNRVLPEQILSSVLDQVKGPVLRKG